MQGYTNGKRLANIEKLIIRTILHLTVKQTKKIGKFPIILVGTSFWSGLIDWIKSVLVEREHTISKDDLNLFKLVDTEDEVLDVLDKFYKKYDLSPNF